jgi:hypothetical protein
MLATHDLAPPDRRIWNRAAAAFATVYAVLISINYYVQLTWVMPRLTEGRTAGMEAFLFVPFDSFLYAVDILGYSFMSLATLAAAMGLRDRTQFVARRFLMANGVILPFIALQMYWHGLIWLAAAWAITFPGATIALAAVFHRAAVAAADQPASARAEDRAA